MLFRLLSAAMQVSPAHGVLYNGSWVHYSRIAEDALRMAALFERRNVQRGDTVAVMLGAEPWIIGCYFACFAIGAVAMPLDPKYARAELTLLLGAATPKVLVTRAVFADKCREALQTAAPSAQVCVIDGGEGSVDEELRKLPPSSPISCNPSDSAIILHSSGSTGRSKLIRRSHGQIMAELEGLQAAASIGADDIFCATAPLFHAYGFGSALMAAIHAQAKLVIAPDAMNAVLGRDAMADFIAEQRTTILPAVPITLDLLARSKRDVDFSSLRLCTSAGTDLPESVFRSFSSRFGIPIRQLYGCSEAGALTVNMSNDVHATWRSVGTPLPKVRIRIDDPDDDGIGVIAVNSPSLTAGYDGLPDVNAQVFVDGWFCTGDRGRIDADGNLYITAKRALYIDVGGHKIDPYEIEDVLVAHPHVREAAVVGVHGRWGARLKAVVVLQAAATVDELRQHCREQLADYKVPYEVEIRDELPRSPLGKVLKKYLI